MKDNEAKQRWIVRANARTSARMLAYPAALRRLFERLPSWPARAALERHVTTHGTPAVVVALSWERTAAQLRRAIVVDLLRFVPRHELARLLGADVADLDRDVAQHAKGGPVPAPRRASAIRSALRVTRAQVLALAERGGVEPGRARKP